MRSKNSRFADPRVPAVLALLIAVAVLLLHTRYTSRYFGPSLETALSAFFPWGKFFPAHWGPHLLRLVAAVAFFGSLPGIGAFLRPLLGVSRTVGGPEARNLLRSPRRPRRPSSIFEVLVDSSLALLFWGTLGLLLAAAGFSSVPVVRAISACLVLAGWMYGRPWTIVSNVSTRLPNEPGTWAGLLFFVFLYFLTTVVPETFYDALVYHLAVPQRYLQEGRWVDMADIHLTRLPGLIQTLYLWPLAWSDDRLCKLMNWGIGLMSAGALGSWISFRWSRVAGLWASLFFLSSPMIGVNLWSCANDILCGLFFFISVALWMEAWDQKGGLDKNRLALSGLLFGAAAATKYTALFGVLFFLWDAPRRQWGQRQPVMTVLLRFGIFAAMPLLPWWFRSWLWTGNPFFPRAAEWLGGDTPENLALLAGWEAEARGEGGFLFRLLAFPRESLAGVDSGRFGFVGPLLLMVLPLILYLRTGPAARDLGICVITSYAFFAVMTGRLRYFIPQLGLLFALSGAAFFSYVQTLRDSTLFRAGWRFARGVTRAFKALLIIAIALNALWLILIFQRFNQGWNVVWGRQSAEAYLREEHVGAYGHPSQGAFDYLQGHAPQGKIFFMGEARTYRSPLPARAAGSFNVPAYARWFKDNPSPEMFLERLQKSGYTYVLVNVPELKRITPGPYKSIQFLGLLGRFLDFLPPPVYRDRWVILFRVPPADGTIVT